LITDLVSKNCYVGSYWSTQPGQSDRTNIDKALAAAMSDKNLNNIVRQYYGNHQITSTSLPSIVLPTDPSSEVTKSDVKRFTAALFRSGGLSGIDFDNTVVNFMLPPRVILSSDDAGGQRSVPAARPAVGLPTEEDEDSLHGLGGYHGSAHVTNSVRIYYAVGAYSAFDPQNGDNGIPIPGWQSWEAMVATFYHELNEARTDPDVEDANDTGNTGLVGWTSNEGAEIGDFPIEAAGGDLRRVFQRVDLADGSGKVPVQFLYSNAVHGPQGPSVNPLSPATTGIDALAMGDHASTVRQARAAPLLTRFAPPANLKDIADDRALQGWSDMISGLFDQGVKRTQEFLQGSPSQFYNPVRTGPAGADTTELPILWQGFPKSIERKLGPGTRRAWQAAEQISGTQVARHQFQDEYLEWFVHRDPGSGKIVRVDFTCEGPEYWSFLASVDPAKVLALYQAHISPNVRMEDLFHNGAYDPLNPWNLTRGAMHLIQGANTLSAEIFIAADATVLRHDASGGLITGAAELIACAGFGVATRASDPHIGDQVNGLARGGFAVTLTDPVGLYIDGLDTTGWTKPDGSQVGNYFKVTRGDVAHTVRAVYEVPQGETSSGRPFVVGDILIGGVPIEFGGQISKNITMRLVGFASGKGSITPHPAPCGGPSSAAMLVATATTTGGTRRLA
jgi:hypothetical protein